MEIAAIDPSNIDGTQAAHDLTDVQLHSFTVACELLSLSNATLAGLSGPAAVVAEALAIGVGAEVAEGLSAFLERLMDSKVAAGEALTAAQEAAESAGAMLKSVLRSMEI